jgi:hypothetical protein
MQIVPGQGLMQDGLAFARLRPYTCTFQGIQCRDMKALTIGAKPQVGRDELR